MHFCIDFTFFFKFFYYQVINISDIYYHANVALFVFFSSAQLQVIFSRLSVQFLSFENLSFSVRHQHYN